MKNLIAGLYNLHMFWKVVWNYRWYDHGFTYDIIVKDLEIREKQWGVNTHYLGDQFTKKRIQVVLRHYYRSRNTDDYKEEYEYERKFLKAYSKLLPRLWD